MVDVTILDEGYKPFFRRGHHRVKIAGCLFAFQLQRRHPFFNIFQHLGDLFDAKGSHNEPIKLHWDILLREIGK